MCLVGGEHYAVGAQISQEFGCEGNNARLQCRGTISIQSVSMRSENLSESKELFTWDASSHKNSVEYVVSLSA